MVIKSAGEEILIVQFEHLSLVLISRNTYVQSTHFVSLWSLSFSARCEALGENKMYLEAPVPIYFSSKRSRSLHLNLLEK